MKRVTRIPKAEIMITPLADVSFTLLVVLMVTTPIMMITSPLNIILPKAATVEPRQTANITVTITPALSPDNINKISINEKVVPFENYSVYLKKEIDAHPDRLVIIKADRAVRHGVVISVISTTKKLGAQRISVGTVQRR
ncbi:biopolymer transporter ExbD [candidate division WOR-3 bacterium]|nr:biopolymer transporter ExbD [candidate division WOR-3 bacterium]TET79558.1 MAG: biopolymer transporter ExbD [Candidatus Cloacimonadota bacterium]